MSGANPSTTGAQYNGFGPYSAQTYVGSTAQWVAFALLSASATFFFTLSYIRNVRPEARLTYYLVTLLSTIAALAYLIEALGSNGLTNNTSAYPTNNAALNTASSAQFTRNLIRTFQWLRYASYIVVRLFLHFPQPLLLQEAL